MGFVQNAIAHAFRVWVKGVKTELRKQDFNTKLTDKQVKDTLKAIFTEKRQSYITDLGVGVYQAYLEGAVEAGFGLDDKSVKNLAYNYAAKIIDYSNEMTSLSAAEAYRGIMNRTKKPYESFSFMEKTFGVDRRAVRTLLNMFDSKDPENKTLAEQDSNKVKKMDQYVAAAINVRAKSFGDEEAFGAKETAKALVWNLAKVQGLTPENAKKRWVTVKDELTCPVCGPMHYKTVELNEKFTLVSGKQVWGPQLHPNCRCKAVMVINVSAPEKNKSIFDRLKARGKVSKSFNDNDWQTQPRSNDGRFGSRGRTAVMERGQAPVATAAPSRPKTPVKVQQELRDLTSDQLHTRAQVLSSKYHQDRGNMTYSQQQAARFEIARTNEAYRSKLRQEHPDIDWLVPQAKPAPVVQRKMANKVASARPFAPAPDVELTTKLLDQLSQLPQVKVAPAFSDPQVKEVLEPTIKPITVASFKPPTVLKLNKPASNQPNPNMLSVVRPELKVPVVTKPVVTPFVFNPADLVPDHSLTEIVNVVNSQVEAPVVATVDVPATLKAQNPEATDSDFSPFVKLDGAFMTVITPDKNGFPERLGKYHTFTTDNEEIVGNIYDAYDSAVSLVLNDVPENLYIHSRGIDVELDSREIEMVVKSYGRMLAARQVEGLGLDSNINPHSPYAYQSDDAYGERVFSYGTYKDGGDIEDAQVPVQDVAEHLSLEDMFAAYEPKIAVLEEVNSDVVDVNIHDGDIQSVSLPYAMKYEFGENNYGMDVVALEGMQTTDVAGVDETFTPDASDMADFEAEFGAPYGDDDEL